MLVRTIKSVKVKINWIFLAQMSNNDAGCTPLESIERIATDLLIFLDASWNYDTVQPVLS